MPLFLMNMGVIITLVVVYKFAVWAYSPIEEDENDLCGWNAPESSVYFKDEE